MRTLAFLVFVALFSTFVAITPNGAKGAAEDICLLLVLVVTYRVLYWKGWKG